MTKVHTVFCPGCAHKVRLTVSEAPPHDGQANLPDGAEFVCLDFGEACTEGACPLTGSPGIVMGVRLARSHLNDGRFKTMTATCQACGNVTELEVLDSDYVFCTVCETTSRWTLLTLDDETRIAVTLG
ncbi:MAG TPA: hypothetical protein VGA70_07400 [Longimicrobiales bacterium]|jgi:uncharacterized Zn finger protein (UPF0148 family)